MDKTKNTVKIGEILLKINEITTEQLDDALHIQLTTDKKIGEIMIENQIASETAIMNALSDQTGIKVLDLDNYPINSDVAKVISEKLANRINSIPVDIYGDKILVAMSNPLDIYAVEDIEMESGRKIEAVFALKAQIKEAIEKYLSGRNAEKAVEDISAENVTRHSAYDIYHKNSDFVNQAPVVRLINSVISQALKMRASDIHIEPFESRVRLRARIDGDLCEMFTLPINALSAIITRVKVMAGMNIAEKRIPQDGRIEMNMDYTTVDMRVSSIPTVYGEKIVMRLLDRGNFLKSKHDLGFTAENMNIVDSIIKSHNGIILIAGPTGSGKTTTLYAYLNELNLINKNIITVEDPVEYKIDGINQIQVNSKIGLSFASGLRSILRQDPDIIMVGEIRDEETAEIAVRSAITGHLVISTIHTNDATSTVIRLQDMGIKPYLIASSLRGVIAQRLVKKICTNCKTSYTTGRYETELLNIEHGSSICKGAGCPKCSYTGYSSRIAVHEVMKVDKVVRDVIYNAGNMDDLLNAAVKGGMVPLKNNLRKLVLDGTTTADEYLKLLNSME